MCAFLKVAKGGGRNPPQLAGKSLSRLAAADALNVTRHEAVTAQIITAESSHNGGLVIMQIPPRLREVCVTGNLCDYNPRCVCACQGNNETSAQGGFYLAELNEGGDEKEKK